MADFERDIMTGMPLLPAQRPLAVAHMVDDDTGEVITETMVLPNLILFWQKVGGVRLGQSVMCSPQYARAFIDALPEQMAEVGERPGRSMSFVDPDDFEPA